MDKCGQIVLEIKPLSINQAWMGRRFKTKKYKEYSEAISYLLLKYKHLCFDGYLNIYYKFYLKHWKTSDYDNFIKALQDVLIENGIIINDRYIMKAVIEKIPSTKDKIEIKIEETTI